MNGVQMTKNHMLKKIAALARALVLTASIGIARPSSPHSAQASAQSGETASHG